MNFLKIKKYLKKKLSANYLYKYYKAEPKNRFIVYPIVLPSVIEAHRFSILFIIHLIWLLIIAPLFAMSFTFLYYSFNEHLQV